jgi:L-ascorbate metabolism protein UlaG (beta-lactamase superfamily)
MHITYFGHSCFLLETRGSKILFDPYISVNELAKDIDINQIKCDFIAVSHGHEDHILDLVPIAKNTGAQVIGCFELGEYLEENGITNFHGMNVGGTFDFPFGTLQMTIAQHSNSFNGRYMGAAGGFVISSDEETFFYAGDTALTYDFKLLAQKFNITTAALPIGGNFTMDYKDALLASDFIDCRQIIALHYDTFPPIRVNQEKVSTYYKNAGKRIHFMQIGQNKEFN